MLRSPITSPHYVFLVTPFDKCREAWHTRLKLQCSKIHERWNPVVQLVCRETSTGLFTKKQIEGEGRSELWFWAYKPVCGGAITTVRFQAMWHWAVSEIQLYFTRLPHCVGPSEEVSVPPTHFYTCCKQEVRSYFWLTAFTRTGFPRFYMRPNLM